MIKLTNFEKQLTAYCYSAEKFPKYELVFDKRIGKTNDTYFAVRLFVNEFSYLLISLTYDDICYVTEWETTKSYYHPSQRCTYLNKYLKKYRNDDKSCTLTLNQLLECLDKVELDNFSDVDDRYTYQEWRQVRRATGRF